MTKPSKLKVHFVLDKIGGHQVKFKNYMIQGFNRHGISSVTFDRSIIIPEDRHLYVVWAWKPHYEGKKWKRIKDICDKTGAKCLVMERAYIGDRSKWLSLGYNGLNGRANFCNSHITDLTRWNEKFSEYQKHDWRKNNTKKAVVIGQVRKDASLAYMRIRYDVWVVNTITQLRNAGYEVIYRPHPEDSKLPDWREFKITPPIIDTKSSIEDTFDKVDVTATWNSNAGVLSVLNGIPIVTFDDGSMVRKVSTHSVSDGLIYPNLDDWKAKISYCQWDPEELVQGLFWETLSKGLS